LRISLRWGRLRKLESSAGRAGNVACGGADYRWPWAARRRLACGGGDASCGCLEITLKASEAPGASASETVKLYSASKALVIGIDNYSAGWPALSGAVKDAKAVAEALKLQGFEVTLIKDPASAELRQAFEDFFITAGTDPDARLFIWFAGHGHTIKSGGEDEGYIVPRDAPDPRVSDTGFRLKAISLLRFGEYMREARAKHVLAVFDSCFGGTVFNVARALPPPAVTRATTLPVRQFISLGDADQEVGDDGTFRRLFIDALKGLEPSADINKDGYLTGTGLGEFLYNKMTNLTQQRQTPRYGKLNALGYDRGDFVFQLREPKAESAAKAAPDGPQPPLSEVARAWSEIKDATDFLLIEAFREQYGKQNPLYDKLASQRVAALKEKPVAEGGGASSWSPGAKPEPAKPPRPEDETGLCAQRCASRGSYTS
jgi:Caspase domain